MRTNKKIYLLFFFSGISGLLYETVWLRMLIRILGSTVYATSVILCVFMAGLAAGSYLFGKWCNKAGNKMLIYAYLEICIGIFALVLIFVFDKITPLYKVFYLLSGENRFALVIFQSLLIFSILFIPTSLMGGTLPLLSAWTQKHNKVFSQRLGYLYGLNTLGGCIGVLCTGFALIAIGGEINTLLLGALINLLVGLVALSLSKRNNQSNITIPIEIDSQSYQHISPYNQSTRNFILIAYFLNGFISFAYEIIWSRIFQIQVGTSIYAFSLMLAFYLMGIASGSLVGAKFISKIKTPLTIYGIYQILIALFGILGLYIFTFFSPVTVFTELRLSNVLIMPFLIVFPTTFIFGLIFPIIFYSYIRKESYVGHDVGRLYSTNTIGCVIGSLVCGFIFIKIMGTRNTILLLTLLNIILAGFSLTKETMKMTSNNCFLLTIIIPLTIFLAVFAPDPYISAVNKGNHIWYQNNFDKVKVYYHKESTSATTTACGIDDLWFTKRLLINGVGVTELSTETKIMAHLPLLLHKDPKNMLIICFGMGTALRSAWTHKTLNCDVVELVPETYECFRYFHNNASTVISDPRIHHYTDDGRNYLLMHDKKYDVITIDPSPPIWSAGTVNLYTKEFFELCQKHLGSSGTMCLWIPPGEFSEVRMIMKTFNTVFPNTYVWRGIGYAGFYMIGLNNQNNICLDRFYEMNKDTDLIADLNEWTQELITPANLINLLVLTPCELERFIKGERSITDNYPYTEFPLLRSIFDETFKYNFDAISLLKWRNSTFSENN